MATRQNQSDTQHTEESTEQTTLPDTTTDTSEKEQTQCSPESWSEPFTAHADTNLQTLQEPRALSEARELADRNGNRETVSKLKSALSAATIRGCIKNVQSLLGIHSELRGTHMFDENLVETAQTVLRRLRAGV